MIGEVVARARSITARAGGACRIAGRDVIRADIHIGGYVAACRYGGDTLQRITGITGNDNLRGMLCLCRDSLRFLRVNLGENAKQQKENERQREKTS